jgi:E3 ubiquitin-protein ligase SHPRH
VAIFFRASAYYQIKTNQDMTKPDSPEFHELEKLETEGYEAAKKLRREILQEVSLIFLQLYPFLGLTYFLLDLPEG